MQDPTLYLSFIGGTCMHKMRSCTYLHNNTTHHKITQLCNVVVNLVSAVDTVFEELNLDLLLLLLLILPLSLISPQQYCHSLQREQKDNRDDKNDLL